MAANPQKYDTIKRAKELYLLLNGNNTATAFNKDAESFRAALEAHINEQTSVGNAAPKKMSRIRILLVASAVAASVLLVVMITRKNTVLPPARNTSLQFEAIQVSKTGERKSFQLPDGSKVMLNAGSDITIAKDFNNNTREIYLQGEAFFDVVHNTEKPFIIHTASMDVKVLGTIFNVKAYPGDKVTETSLLKGSVEVTLNSGQHKKVILHPNEKIILPIAKEEEKEVPGKTIPAVQSAEEKYKIAGLTYNPIDSTLVEVSWTENRLAFNDTGFEEVAAELERWYSVSISFEDDAVKQYRFTATFDRKNIIQVLDALQLTRPGQFEYKIESDNKIVIRK